MVLRLTRGFQTQNEFKPSELFTTDDANVEPKHNSKRVYIMDNGHRSVADFKSKVLPPVQALPIDG